jgi:putative flippase GtrA
MLQSVSKSFDPKAEARRFTLFVVLGGCAALVNWASRFPLERIVSFPVAVAVAYMIGMGVAFTLFSRFVFPVSAQPVAQQIKFFILVNLAGIVQVFAVSIALVYYVFPTIGFVGVLTEPIGHGIAIGVPTISSYFGHRLLTFKSGR